MLTDFNNSLFGNVAAEKILQPNDVFLSYNIHLLYVTEKKQERFRLLSMVPFSLAFMPVYCSFSKECSVPAVANLYLIIC